LLASRDNRFMTIRRDPVDAGQVAPAVDALADSLDPRRCRMLPARINGSVAG
jgi:hypothetical protein